MRILFATMQAGQSYFQGTERYLARLAGGLREGGHEVLVAGGDPLGTERSSDAEVELTVGGGSPVVVKRLSTPTYLSVVGNNTQRMTDVIDSFRPDIVHVLNPAHIGVGVIDAACDAGVPVVVTVMDFWWACPRHTLLKAGPTICSGRRAWHECAACIATHHDASYRPGLGAINRVLPVAGIGSLVRAFGRLSGKDRGAVFRRDEAIRARLQRVSHTIFPSRATRDVVGPMLPAGKESHIPYGVASEWFARPVSERGTGGTLRVGYAGAMAEHKGVGVLASAMARIDPSQVELYIAGPTTGRLAESIRKLCPAAEWAGVLDSDGMISFLDGLDLLVVPSLWPENLPIVALEAGARVVPVLVSDVSGLRDAVSPESLFPPGDVDALAAAIERAIDPGGRPPPPHRPTTIGEMVGATESVYHGVVGGAHA